jgi:sugar phosphate isomerase/epimerase
MTDQVMPPGVFVAAGAGAEAAVQRVCDLGVSTVQISAPPPAERTPQGADRLARVLEEAGLRPTVVFCGFPGESYATIQIVRETVGLVPQATRAARMEIARGIARFAARLGAPAIGIHVGFVPEDTACAQFARIADLVAELCTFCEGLGLRVHLETGQETAPTLLHLIETVGRPNLAVNFDPANMILYGSGRPLEALRLVGRHVRSVHAKDALWSQRPGEQWGEEVPLGEGDVDIPAFVRTLHETGYRGPLTIEREVAGERQLRDIRAGLDLLRRTKRDLGIG